MLQQNELGRIALECYKLIHFGVRHEKESNDEEDEASPRHPKWKSVFHFATLIVGRGVYQNDHKLEGSEIICLDRFGGAFKSISLSQHHHLWLDFNLPKAVRALPIHSLAQIIIDFSTWRYLNVTDMMDIWMDLLEQNGRLVFEGGIASYKLIPKLQNASEEYQRVGEWYFENKNPSHPVLSLDSLEKIIRAYFPKNEIDFSCKSIENLHGKSNNTIRFHERIIIPANISVDSLYYISNEIESESYTKKKNLLSMTKQELGPLLKAATSLILIQVYQDHFAGYQCDYFTDSYPISTSKPVSGWMQVKKRHSRAEEMKTSGG